MRARPSFLAAGLLSSLLAASVPAIASAAPSAAPTSRPTSTPASTPTGSARADGDFADVAVKPVAPTVASTPSAAKGAKGGVETAGGRRTLSLWQLVGRLHPLLVHLPIGWLLLLLLVELAALRRAAGEGWQRLGRGLLVATLLVALPAVVSGLLRADALPPEPLMNLHRNVMLGLVGLLVVALPLRLGGGAKPPLGRRLGYLALLAAAVCLLLWGGHLGGVLVRGPNYLPF